MHVSMSIYATHGVSREHSAEITSPAQMMPPTILIAYLRSIIWVVRLPSGPKARLIAAYALSYQRNSKRSSVSRRCPLKIRKTTSSTIPIAPYVQPCSRRVHGSGRLSNRVASVVVIRRACSEQQSFIRASAKTYCISTHTVGR